VVRRALLEREKELTRLSDELAEQRQTLPRVRIDEPYTFATDRDEDAGRTVRRLLAAHRLPLHAWPEHAGRLLRLHVCG
jgi:predicted dithiol-disulfide oxidoreductase (DUF899 family)